MSSKSEKRLPPIKGIDGHSLVDELQHFASRGRFFEKPTFASIGMARALSDRPDSTSVKLGGVCTDICVISNALLVKAFRPGLSITVDSSCCAGTTPNNQDASPIAMKSCQIAVIKALFFESVMDKWMQPLVGL